jgi:energy-converting hydrogenase Eha subunit C
MTRVADGSADIRRRFILWMAACVLIVGGGLMEIEWARLLGFLLLAASIAAIFVRGRINTWPGMSLFEARLVCAVVAAGGLAAIAAESSFLAVVLSNAIIAVGLVWYLSARLFTAIHRLSRR